MTFTATFDDTAGRVRLEVSAAPATADTALFERNSGGTRWTTVRGGEAVALLANACRLDDYEYPAGAATTYRVTYLDAGTPLSSETAALTPVQTGVWLKNIGRAYLSRKITVTDVGTIAWRARGGAQDIIARTLGVAVTDLRGGAEFTLQVTTPTLQDAADLESRLAAGDVVFLQPPGPDCPIPTGYFWVGDVQRSQHSKRTVRRFYDLPLIEVAAPSAAIVPITATYQSVLDTYATYADLLAGEPTYADVIDMTGVPDVVVT